MSTHRARFLTRELPARSVAEISTKALLNNYAVLKKQAGDQALLPMIKADAYGHGSVWAAQTLAKEEGLYGFGVATLEEGVRLRTEIGMRYRKTHIIVFSGATPWNEEKGQLCEKHGLTPVICRDEDWQKFFKEKWHERLRYELKFNTGMNRLGIHPEKASAIIKQLKTLQHEEWPQTVMSHLAIAEQPDHALSRKQRERFKQLRGLFESALPSVRFSLANSAAIWNARAWELDELTDIVRPGLSLYGIAPWKGAPLRGLVPVMRLKSQVICTHDLKTGDSVGYGAKYTLTPDPESPRRVATLAAGYADGIHCTLSERGHVLLGGKLERVLGRVSMDLSAVSCLPKVKVGEYAEWIAPELDLWIQAEAAGTIPYELLTSVSGRVQRIYD